MCRVVSNDGDGAGRAVEDLPAHRAEQQPTEAAHPAGADDEQGSVGGGIEQGAAREVAHDAARHLGAVADRSGDQVVEDLGGDRGRVLRIEGNAGFEVVLIDVAPRHDGRDGLRGVCRVVDGPTQGSLRMIGLVDADDDAFHGSSLGAAGSGR